MSDPRLQIERFTARHRAAPESPWFLPLGAAHRAAGDLESAQRVLRAGLERHPGHVSARVLLAQVQLEMQQEDAAETNFARVLELDPENVVALRYRAERARRRGALERAYEILRLLLEVDPFDREVQADLGLLSAALERRTRAASEAVPRTPPAALPPAPAASPEVAETVAPSVPAAPEGASRLDLPWMHTIPDPVAPPESPAGALEPPPIDLDRVQRGSASGARLGVDRGPFAPRTPEPPVAPQPKESPDIPGETATPFERALGNEWTWTRSDDRIVVTPSEPPVRGPIRSVEQRVWGTPEATPAPPAAPSIPKPPPPAAPVPSPGADPSDPFSTLTLARIYESQGYLAKALAIYDDMHRRFPDDAEIAAQLTALQRRLAGVAEVLPPQQPRAVPAPTPPEADAAVTWRLVDPTLANPGATTERLRQATSEVRERERERHHTVIGTPPSPPGAPPSPTSPADPTVVSPPPEDVSRGHADFERFLHYVRSLKP